MSDKNMDDKIREYESLLESQPGDIDIYYELLDLYSKRGLLANFTEKSLNLADIYISNNSLEQAEIVCNRIIKLEAENIKAREKLIGIYLSMGNIDKARDTCFSLSRICSMVNQPEKSFEFIQKGIELDPDNLDARLEMAIMKVKQGRIKEGIDQYKELGKAFRGKGELLKAADTYKRVTVLQPDDTETHFALGYIYRELGQLEDAKNAFRFILRYDLKNIKALTELGLVCQEKGEIDSAILAFRKVLDINPVNAEAAGKLGELYLIRGQTEEAVKAYYNGAELYLKQDLNDNAIQLCEIILDINPKFSKALRMIKELGYKLGYISPPPPPEPVYNYDNSIECPSCGEKNRSNALMCFFCGLQFESNAFSYCLHCGAKSKLPAFNCQVCGEKLEHSHIGTQDVDMSFYKITSGTMFATGIKDRLILKYTEIRADIKGMLADIKVIQKFRNNLDKNIEAFYVFPLPGDGAVYDLEIKAGERTIKGKIKEKEEAKRTYEDAMNEGKKASILEDQKENIFNISVANIKPGEEILVTMKYYQTVKYDDGEYELVIPLVLSQKSGETAGEITIFSDRREGREVNIFINLDAGFPLGEVKSPTHLLFIQENGETKREIQLAGEGEVPDKDFILKYTSKGEELETVLSFYRKEGKPGTFMLHVTPKMDYGPEEMVKREMIFVIDRSGSMSWGRRHFTPIDQARKALKACMRTLRDGDTFNIITFSTLTSNFFSKSIEFNDINLKKADTFIDAIYATGGTNILLAMKEALMLPVKPEYLRQIIFLTDGEVKNVDEILSEIRNTLGKARIYTFGIGTTVNRNLLDGMAEMGKGTVQYLTLEQDIEEAIQKFSNQTAFPILTDISLTWENASVSNIYPVSIPDLYFGQILYLLGKFHSAGKSKAILKGMTVSGNFTQEIDVELPAASEEYPVIEIMWAKKRIDHLLKKEKENPKEKHSIREEIIGISMRYKIMTPCTSFVAIDEGEGTEKEEIIRVTVPQLLPEGMKKTLPAGSPVPQTASFRSHAPQTTPPSPGRPLNLVSPPRMLRRSVSPVMEPLSPALSPSRSAGRPMSGIMSIPRGEVSRAPHSPIAVRNTPIPQQGSVMRLCLSTNIPVDSSEEMFKPELISRSEERTEDLRSVRVEEYRDNMPDIAVVDFSPGGDLSIEDEKGLLSEIEDSVGESIAYKGSAPAEAKIVSVPYRSPVNPEMIDRSFRYLARNQSAEGFWSNESDINKRVISTSLAVLAFIKHGHTNKTGNYRGQVSKAIYYIQNNLPRLSGVALSLAVMVFLELHKISGKKKEREDAEKVSEKLKEEWSAFNTVLEQGFAYYAGKNAVIERFIKEGELPHLNIGEGEIKSIKITDINTPENILLSVLSVIAGEKEVLNIWLTHVRKEEPDRGSINISALNPVDTTAAGIFVIA